MNVLERVIDDGGRNSRANDYISSSSCSSSSSTFDNKFEGATVNEGKCKSGDRENISFVINKASVRAWMAANRVSSEPPVDEKNFRD